MTAAAASLATLIEERSGRLLPSAHEEHAVRVVAAVCEARGVSPSRLLSANRFPHVAHTRAIAAYALRASGDLSYPVIGRILGRDHSTVVVAVQKVAERLDLLEEATALGWELEAREMDRAVRAGVRLGDDRSEYDPVAGTAETKTRAKGAR